MNLSESIKSLNYFKLHTAEAIQKIIENHQPLILTENGDAKVIVQNIKDYEQFQESIVMLKILALSNKNLQEGKYNQLKESFSSVRNRIQDYNNEKL
ncbi:MAG: type II toxin-antitoxin system Phd/YefM family antitoxin [Candidatus Cloacimonetes bacterium]|nr:type II toxin-antitoxin system Phd/YefM family antitoxin [Candidatus Cloacimonadota bacterium]